jgi:hypothetical protein
MSQSTTQADLVDIAGDQMRLENRSSTLPEPICMRARSLHLVDLDGSAQRVLELRWGATFRATSNGPQALRLRLKVTSIKEMIPYPLVSPSLAPPVVSFIYPICVSSTLNISVSGNEPL